MITIKLTKKEADALLQGSTCLDMEREVNNEQFDELFGKNFHKELDSACRKIYFAYNNKEVA